MIRVAVIGAGAMGRNHIRLYSELPDVELVGIADTRVATAEGLCRRFGGRAYADIEHLLDAEQPQAVTIAVPTVAHLEVGLQALQRGIHVLIEKPLAFTVDEGQQLIDAAKRWKAHLMVGHIERFNPAVVALKQRLNRGELGRVFQFDARRQGPFPTRVIDVGVVIDLAVHDLDIMRYISGSEIVRVFAETEQRIHSTREDLLTGVVRLADGAVGLLSINWLTPTKIRELSVIGERGMFRVDYLTQDLYFFENATASDGEWDTLRVLRGVSEGPMIRQVIAKKEPLRAELEAFMAAVREEAEVAVTGEDGLQALALAQAIVQSGREHRPIAVDKLS